MSEFDIAFAITLRHEGGLSDDPMDSGGVTKFGISHKAYPDLDIKNLTLTQAKNIYKKDYWDKIHGDLINSQELANKIFDVAVNTGVYTASKYIQKAAIAVSFYNLKIDGVIGPKTLEIINQCDPVKLLAKFRELMLDYYERLNQPNFIRGWKIRLYSE